MAINLPPTYIVDGKATTILDPFIPPEIIFRVLHFEFPPSFLFYIFIHFSKSTLENS